MAHTIVPALHNGKMVFCIVIHAEGMGRIVDHDPAVITGENLAMALRGRTLPMLQIDLLICYEPEVGAFQAKCKELEFQGPAILKFLCRNWQNRDREEMPVTFVGSPRS